MLFAGLRERRGLLRLRRERPTPAAIDQDVQVAEWLLPAGATASPAPLAEAIVRWCRRTAESAGRTAEGCRFELTLLCSGPHGRMLDSLNFRDLELAALCYPERIAAEVAEFLAASTGDGDVLALRVSAALFSRFEPVRRPLRAAS
ncbi:MAG TPA: hypothetical protein VFD32_16910 [Dehalococcoidia bacterium]|nr:hypothetical protein [Dehalococcoidia bacterium]